MKNLFIINEFTTENGRVFTGRDLDNDQLYHLEPLSIKRGGWGHWAVREGLAERQTVAENENITGILPVYGPFTHEQELLIGWEERSGPSVWTDFRPVGGGEALQQFFRDVATLVTAYQLYHRKGFIIGAPVWERIYRDFRGYYFPDPAFLSYIAKLHIDLPVALVHCRPPESFQGHPPGPAGDIFYLGLFIYVALVGEIPYPLVDGWPTQALVRGDHIPLRIKRPDLNQEATSLIDRMLNQYPVCRPTAEEMADKWHMLIEQHLFCSTEKDYFRNIREKKAYCRKHWIKTIINSCFYGRKPVIAAFIIGLSLVSSWCVFVNRPVNSPVEFAERFYRETSNPASVVFQNEVKIMPDIVKERKERLEAARKIVTQPLLELTGIRKIRETGKFAVVEANVTSWRWTEKGWASRNGFERLELAQSGRQWKILKRIKLNSG